MIDPFVSTDCDVRELDGFMLNVERLLASELVAIGTPEECWAALMLWCRAWKQIPGGSLPNDDRILASFSGAGKRWNKVKEVALHGFELCSDGRLYHRFLCAEVERAYAKMVAYRQRREADRERLAKWRADQRETHPETDGETPVETRFGAEGTGTGTISKKEDAGSSLRSEPDADASAKAPNGVDALWHRGLAILGEDRRSLLGKYRKTYGDVVVLAAIVECEKEQPSEPASFFVACCDRRKTPEQKYKRPGSGFGSPGFA